MINYWKDKKVLITGDTGFKGAWLTSILLSLGSYVYGISLEPCKENVLFGLLKDDNEFKSFEKKGFFNHFDLDIRNNNKLRELVCDIKPDFIFHLAAQSLVRESYINPRITWETNVLGTINLLEAIRNLRKVSAVIITTDKVYENFNWLYNYRENDQLGGADPYSSSKASVELAVSSWKRSFYNEEIRISTARAGNVIGGGDWANDRIVPDTINALINNSILQLRYPDSTRPWQHVLDPLSGYMQLAEEQTKRNISGSFNFGPSSLESITVRKLVKLITVEWGKDLKLEIIKQQPKEANFLGLSIDKTIKEINWNPKWKIDKTIYETVKCYKNMNSGKSAFASIKENIDSFFGEEIKK